MKKKKTALVDDPQWYKDAIIYEIHVKSFFDSNNDGIGDFKGLTQKLDYLEDLGVNVIWILPFFPSPQKDDGYDISDYHNVHPDYGNIKDLKEFISESHKRGIRVITELVINHTSDQHPWFQEARKAPPDSAKRNFYVWNDKPDKYKEARIIFQDFESSNWSWDPVAKSYYWHRFYSHQPDLNFESPTVQRTITQLIDFWFKLGVDGLRLDAIPYLYESDGTNCENLPETHKYLKKLRKHVDMKHKNKVFLAEANQWPEDAIAYFGDADECHMAFHFPLMPRIFMAVQTEDRFPIVDILDQTPDIPPSCQWALFLRNHDELTLEMVTDEERDYMNNMYARDPKARINLGIRRRLAPLNSNNRRKIELMNILLFTMPGTPVIYYGDEIGMGDNYYLGDRNGVRTPMQWSSDRNAGFSKSNPQHLFLPVIIDPEYHYEAINVENQEANPSSLLWMLKRFISIRKRFKSFGRGALKFLSPANLKILAYIRSYEDENILVVLNLSRFSQAVDLDLAEYSGSIPFDLFSQNEFPKIKKSPYLLTLGPHSYYLFNIKKPKREKKQNRKGFPLINIEGNWQGILDNDNRKNLEARILINYIENMRWFGGKGRKIQKLKIYKTIPFSNNNFTSYMLMLEISYSEGTSENYFLPISYIGKTDIDPDAKKREDDLEKSQIDSRKIIEEFPQAIIARIISNQEEGLLIDAVYSEKFQKILFQSIYNEKTISFKGESIHAKRSPLLKPLLKETGINIESRILKAEQSNSSVLYGNKLFMKIYRRLQEGENPDFEISRFLTEKTDFANTPQFMGSLEFIKPQAKPVSIAMLQGAVANQGDAWTYTLETIGRYFERALGRKEDSQNVLLLPASFLDVKLKEIPERVYELIGGVYVESTTLLGKRTAQMHLALASSKGNKDFEVEPFSTLYQRSLYQSLRNLTKRIILDLKRNLPRLPGNMKNPATEILNYEKKIFERFNKILKSKYHTAKMRIHGDYHLGQVLNTGKDFFIIDFEGEPARSITERRLKRCPFVDAAGMIRSFHYAVQTAFLRHIKNRPEDEARLNHWVNLWYQYVSGIFMNSYLETAGQAQFIPEKSEEIKTLMDIFLLEKAVYEIGYELNNRPEWLKVPLNGIKEILEDKTETAKPDEKKERE